MIWQDLGINNLFEVLRKLSQRNSLMCQLVASASLVPWCWSHPIFPCPHGNRPQCQWWGPQHQSPSCSFHKGGREEHCSPGGASSASPELCYFCSSRGDLGSVMDTIYSFPKHRLLNLPAPPHPDLVLFALCLLELALSYTSSFSVLETELFLFLYYTGYFNGI